jgi:hypothetical protein
MANVRASPQQMVMVIAGAAGGEVYSINFPAHLWQQTTPLRSLVSAIITPETRNHELRWLSLFSLQ